MSKYASKRVGPWSLTPAEADTIRLVAHGLSLREIAELKHRSARTTEAHGTKAKDKMEVKTLARAAVLFDRWEAGR
jgi:DNA-binding CsgD family transcriptional regulator